MPDLIGYDIHFEHVPKAPPGPVEAAEGTPWLKAGRAFLGRGYHAWWNLQQNLEDEIEGWDTIEAHVREAARWGHTIILWWGFEQDPESKDSIFPKTFLYRGGKWDLRQLNPDFADAVLKARRQSIAAGIVPMFKCLVRQTRKSPRHPTYGKDNLCGTDNDHYNNYANADSLAADFLADHCGRMARLVGPEAILEVCNENYRESFPRWQQKMVREIHAANVLACVSMGQGLMNAGWYTDMCDTGADILAIPDGEPRFDPMPRPMSARARFIDSDHWKSLLTSDDRDLRRTWPIKAFLRGYHPLAMQVCGTREIPREDGLGPLRPHDWPGWEDERRALALAGALSELVPLEKMRPASEQGMFWLKNPEGKESINLWTAPVFGDGGDRILYLNPHNPRNHLTVAVDDAVRDLVVIRYEQEKLDNLVRLGALTPIVDEIVVSPQPPTPEPPQSANPYITHDQLRDWSDVLYFARERLLMSSPGQVSEGDEKWKRLKNAEHKARKVADEIKATLEGDES